MGTEREKQQKIRNMLRYIFMKIDKENFLLYTTKDYQTT